LIIVTITFTMSDTIKNELMDAVRYHGPNQPLTIEKLPVPSSLGPDDVLVEVKAAALCHTELHFCDGTLNLGVSPMTLGHEATGIITECGANVPESRKGERVIVYYYVGCAECRWCKQGQEQICSSLKAEFGFISDGGLAGYLQAPARNALPLPQAMSFVDAAPIACGVTTAVHAAKLARVQEGEWCMVLGVNGVGFGLIQLLKNKYKAKVIAVGRSPEKLNKAKELGAHVVLDNGSKNASQSLAALVREHTGGEGADVIFECVGRRETMDACVGWAGALGRRGRLVMIGYHAGEEHEFRYHPIPMIVNEQTILGSVGATLEDLKEAVQLVADGQVKTVVDCTLPLADFQQGLDKIKNCSCVGKIVCIP
jgi:propanol-preferring alcohol dehydrogenase